MNECQESIVFVLFYCFSYATSFVFLFRIAIKKGKKYNFLFFIAFTRTAPNTCERKRKRKSSRTVRRNVNGVGVSKCEKAW